MKKYLIVVAILFILSCIFKFLHIWSKISGKENHFYNSITEILVVLFMLSIIATFIKFIFRRGNQKLNLWYPFANSPMKWRELDSYIASIDFDNGNTTEVEFEVVAD